MIQVGKEGETLSEPDTVWTPQGCTCSGPDRWRHTVYITGTVKPASVTRFSCILSKQRGRLAYSSPSLCCFQNEMALPTRQYPDKPLTSTTSSLE